jgi:hypothetical protein
VSNPGEFEKMSVPLFFGPEHNFRITSTGIYRRAQREIVAIVYDFDKVKGALQTALSAASQTPPQGGTGAGGSPGATQPGTNPGQGNNPGTNPGAGTGGANSQGTGVPQIVFWQEF